VVVTAPIKNTIRSVHKTPGDNVSYTNSQGLVQSTNGSLHAPGSLERRAINERIDWTADLLTAPQNIPRLRRGMGTVAGIRCPQPLGIVTFEDILDNLLQKTSRDEKGFYDQKPIDMSTEARKEGDAIFAGSRSDFVSTNVVPSYVRELNSAFRRSRKNQDNIQKPRVSTNILSMNGAVDHIYGLDGNDDRSIDLCDDPFTDHSSYTENSRGGFHEGSGSAGTLTYRGPRSERKTTRTILEQTSLLGPILQSVRAVSSPAERASWSSSIEANYDFPTRSISCCAGTLHKRPLLGLSFENQTFADHREELECFDSRILASFCFTKKENRFPETGQSFKAKKH
jgi:hypothetical protein